MKNFLFALGLLALCFAGANLAQEKTAENQHALRGIVRDRNSRVFAGITLFFKSDAREISVSTDINGRFSVSLAPGNYEVAVSKTLSEKFKASVAVGENGLKRRNVEFVVEPNPVCCGASSEKPYPRITKLPKPPYPAAARAVRATGEVVVDVKIDREGKVLSAQAVSGHPLLRQVSVDAATRSLFGEAADDEPREVKLTFVFLLAGKEKERKRYSNLYRVEVIDSIEIILDTASYRKN